MDAERRLALVVGAFLLGAACGCVGGTPAGTGTGSATTAMPTTAPSSAEHESLLVSLVYVPVCGPSEPSLPECAPHPLGDVEVTVRDGDGSVAGQGTTDRTGTVGFDLTDGDYEVRGAPVPSAVTPRPATVTVTGTGPVTVTIRYESNLQ